MAWEPLVSLVVKEMRCLFPDRLGGDVLAVETEGGVGDVEGLRRWCGRLWRLRERSLPGGSAALMGWFASAGQRRTEIFVGSFVENFDGPVTAELLFVVLPCPLRMWPWFQGGLVLSQSCAVMSDRRGGRDGRGRFRWFVRRRGRCRPTSCRRRSRILATCSGFSLAMSFF